MKRKSKIKRSLIIRYEDLINYPASIMSELSNFLDLKIKLLNQEIKKGINDKYFSIWEKKSSSFLYGRQFKRIINDFESEINQFKYSFKENLYE